jgi:hypothetical protein
MKKRQAIDGVQILPLCVELNRSSLKSKRVTANKLIEEIKPHETDNCN